MYRFDFYVSLVRPVPPATNNIVHYTGWARSPCAPVQYGCYIVLEVVRSPYIKLCMWYRWRLSHASGVQFIIILFYFILRQAEVAQGVPGRLRPRIFSTVGTTRVVGRQPNAPAAFTPGETPDTHFQKLSRFLGTWFCRKEPRKKSQVTPPGIDPGTVRLLAQRLNHYATPGPVNITTIH